EKRTGDDAAPRAVHQPADVGGELLRLGSRQHHAVVERVQEAPFRDPALLLDQLAMHDRDLAGWTAEADPAELPPVAERLGATRNLRRCRIHHEPPAAGTLTAAMKQSLDGIVDAAGRLRAPSHITGAAAAASISVQISPSSNCTSTSSPLATLP